MTEGADEVAGGRDLSGPETLQMYREAIASLYRDLCRACRREGVALTDPQRCTRVAVIQTDRRLTMPAVTFSVTHHCIVRAAARPAADPDLDTATSIGLGTLRAARRAGPQIEIPLRADTFGASRHPHR